MADQEDTSSPTDSGGEELLEADADWTDNSPDDKTKLKILSERRKLAEEHQKDWFWHAEIAFEYAESSQIPPELRGLEGDVLYWCLNIIRDIRANIVGSLTASEPVPTWSGRGFDDETGGKAIADLFSFTATKDKIKLKNPMAVMDMVTCGVGGTLEYYDEDIPIHLGPRKMMFGDVASEVLDPLKLLGDPTYCWKDIECPEWMIYRRNRKLRYLKQKFGEKANGIKGKRVKVPQSLIAQRSSKDYDNQNTADNTQTIGGDQSVEAPASSAWTRVAEVEEHYFLISEPIDKVYRRVMPPQPPIPAPPPTVTPYNPDQPDPSASPDAGAVSPGSPPPAPVVPQAEADDGEVDEVVGWEPVDYGPDDIPPGEEDFHWTKRVIVNKVRRALVCEEKLLEDKELHFDTIPISLYLGEKIQNFHMPVGIIYHIRHPQDLINTLISTVGENALLTNNPWTIYEEQALEQKMKDRLENHGSSPGLKLQTLPGQIDKVRRESPPQIPTGILELWKEILGIIPKIAGRYDVQQGNPPYDMSGRGIIASQQAADMSSVGWQQGMLAGEERGAILRLQNIQKKYVYGRALRITDDFGDARVVHLKKTNAGISVVAETGETLLEDLSTAEFDLELKIQPDAMDPPELKQKKGQILFEAGVYTKKRLAEAYGVKHADRVIEERDKEDQIAALGKAALQAIQVDPQIQTLLQNPKILAGLEQDAGAYKNLLQFDPNLSVFLANPTMLRKVILDAIAHNAQNGQNGQGGAAVPVSPDQPPAIPPAPPVGAGA